MLDLPKAVTRAHYWVATVCRVCDDRAAFQASDDTDPIYIAMVSPRFTQIAASPSTDCPPDWVAVRGTGQSICPI